MVLNSAWYTSVSIWASPSMVVTKNCCAGFAHQIIDFLLKSKISCCIIGRSMWSFGDPCRRKTRALQLLILLALGGLPHGCWELLDGWLTGVKPACVTFSSKVAGGALEEPPLGALGETVLTSGLFSSMTSFSASCSISCLACSCWSNNLFSFFIACTIHCFTKVWFFTHIAIIQAFVLFASLCTCLNHNQVVTSTSSWSFAIFHISQQSRSFLTIW